jgi:hypothetical protein
LTAGYNAAKGRAGELGFIIGKTRAHTMRAIFLLTALQLLAGAFDADWISANSAACTGTIFKTAITFAVHDVAGLPFFVRIQRTGRIRGIRAGNQKCKQTDDQCRSN